ncbi:MAG: FKBP-type peptidyl-prolyl cis-trans isomerase [Agathobacter sp.]
MKKRTIAILLCMTTALAFAGCGKNAQAGDTQSTQGTEAAVITYNGPSSAQMDIDLEKQVTKLADYDKIDVTISGDYEVTDDQVKEHTLSLLPYYGITGIEVKDRDTVKDGDYVKVDYTGYHKGEAFEGGAAEDVMLDVTNNTDVVNQTGFIDGFTDGLKGAKVGDEVSSDVTFPEEYPQNEDLAGEKTTFKFKVKGIYEPVTLDKLTDDMVAEAFTEEGLKTKDELIQSVKEALTSQAESNKNQDTVSEVEDYVVKNSQVDIPEDYLNARLSEYQKQFSDQYCSETQSLEEYLTANGTTLADQQKSWKSALEQQIKIEFLFGRIAELEKIEVDEDDFAQFVNYLISSSSQMSTEDEVYEYYGNGSKEDGEKSLRQLYRVNKAISHVAKNANVTVDKGTDTEEN